ncbi:MAG TPA: hypothetical protein GXX75_18540 [Clostridiales bacterium]|nr:hypothetical protein [Clostridiales bacterium]
MKRLTVGVLFLIIVSFTLAACHLVEEGDDPVINLHFSASDLEDEEYESIGTAGLESPTKADFKNIEFTLEVKHSDEITNRQILMPEVKQAANSYDEERYWFGRSYRQDNPQENFAQYGYSFVLYTHGLDEQGIRDIFKAKDVKISWVDEDDVYEEQVFDLGDILQFEE